MRRSSLILLATLAGCASTPAERDRAEAVQSKEQAGLAAELAGLTPGEPTACLPELSRTQLQTKGYGDTVVYVASRNVKYRTDTTGGCRGVGRDDILITRTPATRVCRGDIAQTIDRTSRFPTGSCAFGDFVPYKRR